MIQDMPQKEDSIREKILLATINVIERDGIQDTTVRGIAKEAGVNSAAINYYFGTKENLVNLALNRSLDEGLIINLREVMDLDSIGPREKLTLFLDSIIMGAVRWPQITRTHFYKPFIEGDYSGEVVVRFHRLLNELYTLISRQYPSHDPMQMKYILAQMIASIMFIGLMPGLFTPSLDPDFLTSEESQKRFVRSLIDRLLPE